MRIAVVGPGGVGGFFGGCLARSGQDVVFIARGRTLAALERDGLSVKSPRGDFSLQPVAAAGDPAEVGPVDAVLVCVKAWQVAEVAPSLAPLLGPDTPVLPLQNGVEAPNQLAAALGPEHALVGLCKILSRVEAPGRIHHLGAEPWIALGERDNRPSPRVEALARALREAGVTVEIPGDVWVALWEKFLFMAAVGGVGAVTRVPIGTLRRLPETRALVRGAMEEVRAVALARGIAVPEDAAERTLAFIDTLPAEGTASMQRDLMAGRPSELESQSGAVVRLGREAGVEVPLNTFLYHCLLPSELAARGEG